MIWTGGSLTPVLAVALVLAVAFSPMAHGQTKTPSTSAAQPPFKLEQLEQIVSPIALYPDALLAQIFMASTYPLEVVEAARFAKDNAKLKGAVLNEALKGQTWDDSVKSLVSDDEGAGQRKHMAARSTAPSRHSISRRGHTTAVQQEH